VVVAALLIDFLAVEVVASLVGGRQILSGRGASVRGEGHCRPLFAVDVNQPVRGRGPHSVPTSLFSQVGLRLGWVGLRGRLDVIGGTKGDEGWGGTRKGARTVSLLISANR
jgi:hypothetical protein